MRRSLLGRLLGLPALALAAPAAAVAPKGKILIKSAWGSADPTQASFAFHHANAFAEAGHEVQIFLLGEAVSLMRTVVANAVVPVGWPPLAEALAKAFDHKIPIHV
jgi:predicted peroxiredoxin